MNEIINLLTNDLVTVGLCLLVLGISYLANMVLSMFFNIQLDNQKLDKKKLLKGALMLLTLIVGTALLVVAVDLSVYVFGIDETTSEAITIATIIATIGVAVVYYIKDAYETFKSILNYQKGDSQ